ncbi:unnamed protein product [Amaranthus hypochondriacus]
MRSAAAVEKRYSVDDALLKMGFGKMQFLILAYAGMGWIAEAMEMMLLSFAGPALQSQWNLTDTQESLITTTVFAGMLIGSSSWGFVSDKYGRRKGFLFSAIVTAVTGVLCAISPNYVLFLISRFVVGIGIGAGPVFLTWFLEFVPAPSRGIWMVLFQVFWTLGSIAEAGLAWVVMPKLGWRWLMGLSVVPAFVLLVFYIITPESPRYLCLKGRKNEALQVLAKVSKMNGKELPDGVLVSDIELEENIVPVSTNVEGDQGLEWKDSEITVIKSILLLLSRKLARTTLLLWVVFFGNAFAYYGLVLLATQLNSKDNSCAHSSPVVHSKLDINYKSVFITTFAELPGLVIAGILIDQLGRKYSMALMFVVCSAFLFSLAHRQTELVTTILMFGARACIMGTFTIAFIFAPELYPTSVRNTGFGTASAVSRIGGMVSPFVAIALVQACHQMGALLFFAGTILVAAVSVLLIPLETNGLELTDTIATNKKMKPKAVAPDVAV